MLLVLTTTIWLQHPMAAQALCLDLDVIVLFSFLKHYLMWNIFRIFYFIFQHSPCLCKKKGSDRKYLEWFSGEVKTILTAVLGICIYIRDIIFFYWASHFSSKQKYSFNIFNFVWITLSCWQCFINTIK